ncbi:MAG: MFS transporter [Alistipes sp.]
MKRHHYGVVGLIMIFWFVISFITNIIGPLIPDIINNFQLSHLALAGFIPTSFFVAYGIMSIPAGLLIEKFSQKTVLTVGFILPLVGALIFALWPTFPILLGSSFTIGLGMAMLQTTINPLTRSAGGEENFAFFSVMGQLVFGAASFVSPFVYTHLVKELTTGEKLSGFTGLLQRLTPESLPWVSLYWLFALILVVVIIVVLFSRFPRIELQANERTGSSGSYRELLHNKYVYLFFIGMLCYTATEQGISNWLSKFLEIYHGLDPQSVGAAVVGRFWGYMSVGCLVGLFALRLWRWQEVLKVSGALSLITLFAALFGSTEVSVLAFPLIGFSISVMFSIIMSTALNSVERNHGSFAGILCTGIAGGALGPLIVGGLGDLFGLRIALLFVALTICYITSIAFWAHPLVENKRVNRNELFRSDSK